MAFLVASTGSTLSDVGTVYGASAAGAAVWLQLVAGNTIPGASCLIYNDSTSTAGRQIARLTAGACTMSPIWGPMISSCQIYVGNLTGGCVNCLTKPLVG